MEINADIQQSEDVSDLIDILDSIDLKRIEKFIIDSLISLARVKEMNRKNKTKDELHLMTAYDKIFGATVTTIAKEII